MAQKPLTMTQAKATFLKQANHYTRLGKPSNDDAKLLLNSLAGLLAVQTGQDNVRVRFDMHDVAPEVMITRPRPASPQWGINWPEEPDSYRYFAVKSEYEALEMANTAREWTKNQFAESQIHLEIYPVMWEADFGDHAENLAKHYESLKADLEKCESWAFEKIGYADKDLKFYSIADYWSALKARSNINAHYPVFAHIIKSGEHGLEALTLRTLRDDIDQLLSAVQTQPVTIAESTPVEPVSIEPELVTIDWSQAPEGATHWHEGDWTRWTGKKHKEFPLAFALDVFISNNWEESYYGWNGTLEAFIAHGAIPRPVIKITTTRPEPIESLSLTIRAESALVAAGIETVPALLEKTESELLKIEGFGKKSLVDVKTNLEQRGLALGSAK